MYNVSNRTGRAQLYLRKSAQFCPRQPASTRTCLKREFPAALPRWNCYLPALQGFQIFSKCFKGHKMSQTSSPGSASVKSKPMTVALTPQCLFGTASSLAIGFCKSDEQQWNSTVISNQDPSKFSVNSICNKKFTAQYRPRLGYMRPHSLEEFRWQGNPFQDVPSILCAQNFKEPWTKQENTHN